MTDDADLKPVSEAMAEWDQLLPLNHGGRTLLKALTDMDSDILDHRAIEGPEETGSPFWRSLFTIGTTADGALRFFLYPAPNNGEELQDRDTLLRAILSQPGKPTTPEEARASVPEPATTLVFAYYGERKDGVKLIGVAWKRDISFAKAIGHLKLAIRFIREKEAEAMKGGS